MKASGSNFQNRYRRCEKSSGAETSRRLHYCSLAIPIGCLFLLGACNMLPSGQREARLPEPISSDIAWRRSETPSVPKNDSGFQDREICLARLRSSGVSFSVVPDTMASAQCNLIATVQISALGGDDTVFAVHNIGPVQCEVARTFNDWVRFGVDRAAREILGSGVKTVLTMGSYACRRIAGTEFMSAHSRAAAIDVSGFVLEDGRRIELKRDWGSGSSEVRRFLRVVHASACKRFSTVLGPEYNAAHADHFHLEGIGPKFCR